MSRQVICIAIFAMETHESHVRGKLLFTPFDVQQQKINKKGKERGTVQKSKAGCIWHAVRD